MGCFFRNGEIATKKADTGLKILRENVLGIQEEEAKQTASDAELIAGFMMFKLKLQLCMFSLLISQIGEKLKFIKIVWFVKAFPVMVI